MLTKEEEEEFLGICAQCIKAGIRLRRAEEDALQARDIYDELLNNVQKEYQNYRKRNF